MMLYLSSTFNYKCVIYQNTGNEENCMKKKLIQPVLWIISVIIAAIVIPLFIDINPLFETSIDKSSETALLREQMVEMSELTTLKYEYSNVIVSRTDKSFSFFDLPDFKYAEAIRLIEYSGYLKAGTDLSKMELSIDEASKNALVTIPEAQILDNVVETEQMTVEDVKGTIFSDYPTQIIIDEINTHKKQLEEEKISQGFLEEANEKAKSFFTSVLDSHGYKADIKFK